MIGIHMERGPTILFDASPVAAVFASPVAAVLDDSFSSSGFEGSGAAGAAGSVDWFSTSGNWYWKLILNKNLYKLNIFNCGEAEQVILSK